MPMDARLNGDPEFEVEQAAILGLQVDPPDNAQVLAVNKKHKIKRTSVGAIDTIHNWRLQGHDYFRIMAATGPKTLIPSCRQTHFRQL